MLFFLVRLRVPRFVIHYDFLCASLMHMVSVSRNEIYRHNTANNWSNSIVQHTLVTSGLMTSSDATRAARSNTIQQQQEQRHDPTERIEAFYAPVRDTVIYHLRPKWFHSVELALLIYRFRAQCSALEPSKHLTVKECTTRLANGYFRMYCTLYNLPYMMSGFVIPAGFFYKKPSPLGFFGF